MKRGNLIYFLLALIIINILSILPSLFIIITVNLNGYGWLFKHTISLRNYLFNNKIFSSLYTLRAYIWLIPQIYDLVIFGISLNYGIVGINMAILIFEMFIIDFPKNAGSRGEPLLKQSKER
jgi:hypothetical protein